MKRRNVAVRAIRKGRKVTCWRIERMRKAKNKSKTKQKPKEEQKKRTILIVSVINYVVMIDITVALLCQLLCLFYPVHSYAALWSVGTITVPIYRGANCGLRGQVNAQVRASRKRWNQDSNSGNPHCRGGSGSIPIIPWKILVFRKLFKYLLEMATLGMCRWQQSKEKVK